MTDRSFVADRLALALERAEQEAENRWRAETGKQDDTDDDDARRKAERAAQQQLKIEARGRNLALGIRLQKRYAAPRITKDIARLFVLLALGEQGEPAAGRLALTREDWQTVETRTAKTTGRTTTKVTYPDRADAARRLETWLADARTPEEVFGRALQVLLAATHADLESLSKSAAYKLPWSTRAGRDALPDADAEIARLLGKLAKPILVDESREA